jgi:hypothetical protein
MYHECGYRLHDSHKTEHCIAILHELSRSDKSQSYKTEYRNVNSTEVMN